MTPPSTPPNQARRLRGARIAALVSAALIAVLSLGLLAAGGWGLWGDSPKRDHGYISSGYHRYMTRAHAIATDNLDVGLDGPLGLIDHSAYGSVRLKVTPGSDKPVFIGIARSRDVDAYLGRTSRDVVADLDFSPFRVDYDRAPGEARPSTPDSQHFWAASAQGSQTQTLTWDVADGNWSVVVMNADGSAGVDARVSAGAKLPWLTAVGWGTLGAGALGLIIAGLISVLAARSPQPTRHAAPVAA
jgi:hypothetical protein